jgi:hypothetical protein
VAQRFNAAIKPGVSAEALAAEECKLSSRSGRILPVAARFTLAILRRALFAPRKPALSKVEGDLSTPRDAPLSDA